MLYNPKKAFVCLTLLFTLPGLGKADLITFDSLGIDHLVLAGPQVEGAFQYQATTGPGWEVQTLYGNPTSALVTFFNGEGSAVGDTVAITRVGGGLFTFNSVDYATIFGNVDNHVSDHVVIDGFLGGNPAGSLALNSSTASPNTFLTVPSGFGSPIDLLRIQVSLTGDNAMLLDNFNLTVPEPASLTLLGLASLLALLRRENRLASR